MPSQLPRQESPITPKILAVAAVGAAALGGGIHGLERGTANHEPMHQQDAAGLVVPTTPGISFGRFREAEKARSDALNNQPNGNTTDFKSGKSTETFSLLNGADELPGVPSANSPQPAAKPNKPGHGPGSGGNNQTGNKRPGDKNPDKSDDYSQDSGGMGNNGEMGPAGEITPQEEFIYGFLENFYDPEKPHKVIDGFIHVDRDGGKNFDRPEVAYDPKTDTTLVAYYDKNASTGVGMYILNGNERSAVSIYSRDGESAPALKSVIGEIEFPEDPDMVSYFKTTDGQIFGGAPFEDGLSGPAMDTLDVVEGQLVLKPVENKGGPVNPDINIRKARENFANPDVEKTVLKGMVDFNTKSAERFWLKDPVFFQNSDGTVILGSSTEKDRGELVVSYFNDPRDITVYSYNEDGSLPVDHSKGIFSFGADPTGESYGRYTYGEGATAGEYLVGEPKLIGRAYGLVYDQSGRLVPQPLEGPRG